MKSLLHELLDEYYRNRRVDRHLLYEDWEDIERHSKGYKVYAFPQNLSTPNLAVIRKQDAAQGPTMQETVNSEWNIVSKKARILLHKWQALR